MNDMVPRWTMTTIGSIAEYISRGKSPKYAEKSALPVINQRSIRWFGLQNEHLKFVHEDQFDQWSAERYIRVGDILWNSTGTGTIGRACLVLPEHLSPPKVVDSHVTILRPLCYAVEPRYLFSYIRGPKVQGTIEKLATGTTDQIELSRGAIADMSLPLAPLREQKRIADKLDTLFARVDACRKRLDRVPAILKRFRQSVLAAATTGELTSEWRAGLLQESNTSEYSEDNGAGLFVTSLPSIPSAWRWVTFGSLITSFRSGTTAVPVEEKNKFQVLRSSSVRQGRVDLEDVRHLSPGLTLRDDCFLEDGDLLFTRLSGSLEYVANCALVRGLAGRRIQYPDRLFRAKLKDPPMGPYLELCFGSPILRRFLEVESKSTAGHQRISMGAITEFPIPLPPADERIEIIRRVLEISALSDQLGLRAIKTSTAVEKLTTSTLAKAFRGSLVPQDPNDEPASKLLERIQAERAAGGQSQLSRGQRLAAEKQAESRTSPSTPTPKRDRSPQTAPIRPRRPPSPTPEPEDTAAPDRRPLDDYTTDEMMAHFRAASRASGEMTEEGLFHLVLARLGFERLGAKVTSILKGHLKAAIGRGIIERDGFFVRCKTPTILRYERPVLVDALTSVMRKNQPYEREEVIQALAVHLGYSSVSDAMRETMKSVFNSAIRQGVLIREGSTITRGD